MKAISQLLFLSCILTACTLIGYDKSNVDAGLDGGRPNDGGKTEDATIVDASSKKDAAETGPEMDAGMPDSAIDSGPTMDGAARDSGRDASRDAAHDARHTEDASARDAGRRDAEHEDAGL